ncbi:MULTISPECIES: DUF420 domain-containing protein [Nosocomiicoccus]|uniref:DUF420 domain-containing protein n=2 Tax=Nosocomiicoccus TaxID=489909 RepID=A0AAF1BNF4_9STAP|nr:MULTISPECIES: DUF420 domain-containing protein [Nosocomiicoccus]OFS62512.1 hypothetical protein HMPREF3177_05570 [Nosocomiicoccus sp. HMSC09A07]WOS96185.1 DUF420 domain-containing protein [Nosocomiicoccus massiliensis]
MNLHFILPTISTSFIVLSAIMMAIGLYKMFKKRDLAGHDKFMTLSAWFALIFFIIYLSKTVFLGSTKFGGPEHLVTYYVVFLISHIILSTTGGVLGGFQVFTGKKRILSKHRKVGIFAAVIWFLTAITGVTVYILLYVLYPGGETSGLLDAIFH